jgi:uncharacterized protein (TIGR03067 family)
MKANLPPAGLQLLCAAILSTLCLAHADDAAWRKRLLGTWEGAVVSDEETGARRATIRELTITQDRISAIDGDGRSLGEGSYKLAEEGGFLTIDATGVNGPATGQTMLGIWKLEGDTLRWCSANAGRPRPGEFKTRSSGPYLMVLTRRKN